MIAWAISLITFGCACFCALPAKWVERRPMISCLVIVALLLFPLIKGLSLFDYLRGAFGDLSLLSLSLLLVGVGSRLGVNSLMEKPHKTLLLMILVIAGIPFYAATLGMSYFDPYRWGYDGLMLLPLMIVSLFLVWMRSWWLAFSLTIIVVLWSLGTVLESRNLWDYLLDPLLVIYAMCVLLLRGACSLWIKLRAA